MITYPHDDKQLDTLFCELRMEILEGQRHLGLLGNRYDHDAYRASLRRQTEFEIAIIARVAELALANAIQQVCNTVSRAADLHNMHNT